MRSVKADIGIAGGVGVGLLIKGGEIVSESAGKTSCWMLRKELLNWDSNGTQK